MEMCENYIAYVRNEMATKFASYEIQSRPFSAILEGTPVVDDSARLSAQTHDLCHYERSLNLVEHRPTTPNRLLYENR